MEFDKLIVHRLLTLCHERDTTVNRIATLAELSQTAVQKIMTGETKNPSFYTLSSLALGLGMTLAEFLDFPEMNELRFQELRKFKKAQKEALQKPPETE